MKLELFSQDVMLIRYRVYTENKLTQSIWLNLGKSTPRQIACSLRQCGSAILITMLPIDFPRLMPHHGTLHQTEMRHFMLNVTTLAMESITPLAHFRIYFILLFFLI